MALPRFSVGIFAMTLALATRKQDQQISISILDNLGGLTTPIVAELKDTLPDGRPAYQVVHTRDRPASAGRIREDLGNQVRAGRLEMSLEVPKDILRGQAVDSSAIAQR